MLWDCFEVLDFRDFDLWGFSIGTTISTTEFNSHPSPQLPVQGLNYAIPPDTPRVHRDLLNTHDMPGTGATAVNNKDKNPYPTLTELNIYKRKHIQINTYHQVILLGRKSLTGGGRVRFWIAWSHKASLKSNA